MLFLAVAYTNIHQKDKYLSKILISHHTLCWPRYNFRVPDVSHRAYEHIVILINVSIDLYIILKKISKKSVTSRNHQMRSFLWLEFTTPGIYKFINRKNFFFKIFFFKIFQIFISPRRWSALHGTDQRLEKSLYYWQFSSTAFKS